MSKIITLFIQAHGFEDLTTPVIFPGVKLLSFYSDEYVRDVSPIILFDVLPYYLRSIYR
jgi:hypothetical protein